MPPHWSSIALLQAVVTWSGGYSKFIDLGAFLDVFVLNYLFYWIFWRDETWKRRIDWRGSFSLDLDWGCIPWDGVHRELKGTCPYNANIRWKASIGRYAQGRKEARSLCRIDMEPMWTTTQYASFIFFHSLKHFYSQRSYLSYLSTPRTWSAQLETHLAMISSAHLFTKAMLNASRLLFPASTASLSLFYCLLL